MDSKSTLHPRVEKPQEATDTAHSDALAATEGASSHEWRSAILLSLGFGLVGLDRWIIGPLFPAMMHDLHMSYQDLGDSAGALAIAWGLASIGAGRLSDLLGRRRVIITTMVLFSVTSALTGVITGVISLIAIRALMGVMEGGYTPACTAAASEVTIPARRGRVQGLVFCTFPLFGLGLGPIVATRLLQVMPSWRPVFFLVAIPGLLLAACLYWLLPETATAARLDGTPRWGPILRVRNVRLGIVVISSSMSCVFMLGAMLPSYLMDYLHVSQIQMGIVTSSLGIGGCLGNFLLPAISDFVGRRTTILIAAAAATIGMATLMHLGPDITPLYATTFFVAILSFGIISVVAGPLATEAVPVTLAASAIGLVAGTAELFGGGVAPIIAGAVAQHWGIRYVPYVGLSGLLVAMIASIALTETAPRRVKRSNAGLAITR